MTRSSVRTLSRSLRLALALLPAACATPQERIAAREDRLAVAGFLARPADTPQRAAMLQRLPDNGFASRDVNGRPVFLYADPLVCGCLYVGSGSAFDRYRERLFQERLTDEQLLAAQPYPVPAWPTDGWGGPWDRSLDPDLR